MASTSEGAVAVGTLEGQGSQIPKRRNEKECKKCGQNTPNATKRCKGCGEEIEVKAFDWEAVQKKKKTHSTQQRKMLEYRANVLHEHHGWDVIVLCLAKHKRAHPCTLMEHQVWALILLDPKRRRLQRLVTYASIFLRILQNNIVAGVAIKKRQLQGPYRLIQLTAKTWWTRLVILTVWKWNVMLMLKSVKHLTRLSWMIRVLEVAIMRNLLMC
ncbi:uncharacterized protein [Acropora muricata]|uniref:uncharacterized protein isoform X3 n=1 Tax=Acropora muricata TaxID=159855 RepID=UPI0034E48D6C